MAGRKGLPVPHASAHPDVVSHGQQAVGLAGVAHLLLVVGLLHVLWEPSEGAVHGPRLGRRRRAEDGRLVFGPLGGAPRAAHDAGRRPLQGQRPLGRLGPGHHPLARVQGGQGVPGGLQDLGVVRGVYRGRAAVGMRIKCIGALASGHKGAALSHQLHVIAPLAPGQLVGGVVVVRHVRYVGVVEPAGRVPGARLFRRAGEEIALRAELEGFVHVVVRHQGPRRHVRLLLLAREGPVEVPRGRTLLHGAGVGKPIGRPELGLVLHAPPGVPLVLVLVRLVIIEWPKINCARANCR
mmetsp:Transcript_4857/g.7301  ORF Transcript_4857/g.7301 Transcript_4857/m.7301 type:complete len:295 (-) Transcript_4857:288-1172(-)